MPTSKLYPVTGSITFTFTFRNRQTTLTFIDRTALRRFIRKQLGNTIKNATGNTLHITQQQRSQYRTVRTFTNL